MYYEDVMPGQELPPLLRHPTTRQLVMWATASGDFNEIHYDQDRAIQKGMKGVVVHGRLGFAWLGQLVTGWMGQGACIKKISAQFRKVLYPGNMVTCRGRVAEKYLSGGERLVRLDLWIEDYTGATVTTGAAEVALPGRRTH